jgi:hypothetical protein
MSSGHVIAWGRFRRRARHGGAVLFEFHGGGQEWVPNWACSRRTAPTESPDGTYPERLELARSWAEKAVPELVARIAAGPARRHLATRLQLVKAESSTMEAVLDFVGAYTEARLSLKEAAVVLGMTERQVSALWQGWLRFEDAAGLQLAIEALQAEQRRRAPAARTERDGGH